MNTLDDSEKELLEFEVSLGTVEGVRPFDFDSNRCIEGGSSSAAVGGNSRVGLRRWQPIIGGGSLIDGESDDEHDLQVKQPKVTTDIQFGLCGSPSSGNQSSLRDQTVCQAPEFSDENLDSVPSCKNERGEGTSAKEEEYEHRMDLTDDLLHMVFSFLDHIHLCQSAMVCKQWRAASAHEDFWRRLNFENKRISTFQFEDMCRRYPNAKELNILGTPLVHVLAVYALTYLRNLEVLTVGKGPLGDPFFQALTDCSMLRRLTIHDAMLGNGIQEISIIHEQMKDVRITECRVLRITLRCPQLKILSLKRSNMAHAALNCPLLRVLDLGSCHKLSDAAVRLAVTSCPKLKLLDISNCSSVSDETLREIGEACASLRTLDASYCPNISFETVRLNMLATLKLDSCEGVNSVSIAAIANCRMLEVLEIKNCSLLTIIGLELPQLTRLKLDYCRRLVYLCLRCANLSSITVSNCAALRRISIASYSLQKLVLQRQESLSTLVLLCPSLQEVDLTDCKSLTNDVCQVFSDSGGCPILKSLILDNCESLKSVKLSSISLISLSLVGCRGITSLELQCPHLELVCLDGCESLKSVKLSSTSLISLPLVGCRGITSLELQCPHLELVCLDGCESLKSVKLSSTSLISLSLVGCRGITSLELQCPHLELVCLDGCESLKSVKLSNTSLISLSLVGCRGITSLELQCPHLELVCLDGCESLKSVKLSSTSLISLSLVGCWGITSLELECPHLELVCLDGCDHLKCASFSSVNLTSLNLGICPKLAKLNIDAPHMVSLELKGCGVLSEASINCPILESLDASFCSQLTDECLSIATYACPLIVSLILMSCPLIGSEGLLSLHSLQNLTSLDLSYTFLVDLEPVYEACRQLRVLKLQACKDLAETSLEPLYKKDALPSLRELDLSYCTLCQKAIEELLAYCTRLTHVSLNGCINMHDLDWGYYPDRHLQFGCDCDSFSFYQHSEPAVHLLQNLNCVGCQNIRKVHIPSAAQCSFLSSLNLSLSANLKEVDITCSNLSMLNLSNCSSLEKLKLQCPKLTCLFLQSCNISVDALEDFISQCVLLETLNVRFCPKIPPSCMGSLRAGCPSLKLIYTGTLHEIP